MKSLDCIQQVGGFKGWRCELFYKKGAQPKYPQLDTVTSIGRAYTVMRFCNKTISGYVLKVQ